jgi:hypothetical protein
VASKKISEFTAKLTAAVDADQIAILDSENADDNARITRELFLDDVAKTADLGTAAALDVGTGAGDVAAGNAPAAAASTAVGTHESTYDHANLPTTAQKAALDGAASPSGANVFATINDLGGGGSWDGDIADIDLDGGTDIGADLADADLILVDDGAAGTNRKSALSRVWTYISAKIAALTDISGWAAVLDEDTMGSDSATKVPTQQSVKAYADTKAPKYPARATKTAAASTDFELNGSAYTCQLSADITTLSASLPSGGNAANFEYGCRIDFTPPASNTYTVTIPGTWEQAGPLDAIILSDTDVGILVILSTKADGTILYTAQGLT